MGLCGPRRPIGGPITDDQAERILNAVLDAGINYIDTSFDYGLSEDYIGRFTSHRRDEYYLATKCGCHVVDKGDHDEVSHVWTRENLMHNIEVSLKRLKTDYLDVWQLHGDHTPDNIQAAHAPAVHRHQLRGDRLSGKAFWPKGLGRQQQFAPLAVGKGLSRIVFPCSVFHVPLSPIP